MEPEQQERRQNRAPISELPRSALPSFTLPPSTGKTYRGERHADGSCEVQAEEIVAGSSTAGRRKQSRPLPLHLGVRNHSPTGFAWGYGGSGPAQLALALLIDATGDQDLALRHHQDFKWRYVGGWGTSWSISQAEIRQFIAAQSRNDPPEASAQFPTPGECE